MNWLENMQKLKIIDGVLVLGLLLVVVGIGMNFREGFLAKEKTEIVSQKISPTIGLAQDKLNDVQSNSEVVIDVGGEVMNPGVYKLKNGDRIDEALIAAGGLGAKADREWVEKNLNKAEKLYDGEKIYIPKVGENNVLGQGRDVLQNVSTKFVRLNSATVEELDKLDGVGPAIAQRIIDYRVENGGFKNIEEIKLVPGIGDKMFEKIKNEIQL